MTAEQLRSRAPWRLLDRRPWVLALCLCFFARASLRAGQVPDAFRRMPHGPQLPSATVRELLQITAGGVSDRELPRLRDTVVGALALLYRAQAARGAGDAWEEGAFNDFWSWLEKQGKLYPTLTLAIHPRDRVSNVFQVVDVLRRSFPREVEEWPHLVVAYAVVWDEPAAVKGVRDGTLWGEHLRNAVDPPTMADSFRWLAESRARHLYPLDRFRWPYLVFVADNDARIEDRAWAVERYYGGRDRNGVHLVLKVRFMTTDRNGNRHWASKDERVWSGDLDLGRLALEMPYDDGKFGGKPARIGTNPTTLPNLLKYGGVCSETAYFVSRVCKSFGVPAAAIGGVNSYGSRHAWAGHFAIRTRNGRRVPRLAWAYRFMASDETYMFVGTLVDPQTLETMTDRELALFFDGAVDPRRYERARLLWRVSRWVRATDEDRARVLLRASLAASVYFAPAWLDLADLVARGRVPRPAALDLVRRLMKDVREHPDLLFALLGRFLQSIPENEVDARNGYYERARDVFAADAHKKRCGAARRELQDLWRRQRELEHRYSKLYGKFWGTPRERAFEKRFARERRDLKARVTRAEKRLEALRTARIARPDLEARLRLTQANYLRRHGRTERALGLMVGAARESAENPWYVLPLAKEALSMYERAKRYDEGKRFGRHMLTHMPRLVDKTRVSLAFAEFCTVFIRFCNTAGARDEAAKWQKELDSARHGAVRK